MCNLKKLLALLIFTCLTLVQSVPLAERKELFENSPQLQRFRRQFDLTVSADHDDNEDETEIALEAIANLWRSTDGNTQVEGSAKVIHRSNSQQSGNTHVSAHLHLHHDYKKSNL